MTFSVQSPNPLTSKSFILVDNQEVRDSEVDVGNPCNYFSIHTVYILLFRDS